MHPDIFQALDFHTPPKLVMFDLDGTLVDSAYDIAAALDSMLAINGLPLAGESKVRQWVGNGAERLVRRALVWVHHGDAGALSPEQYENEADRLPEPELQQYLQQFLEAYQQAPIDKTVLYPGVKESLQSLFEQNIQLAVITNKPIALTWPILKGLGIDHFFSLVLGGDSLPEKKPSPLPLQHALDFYKVSAQDSVMVGDSKADIYAAQAAEVKVVAVNYGYSNGVPVQNWQPNCVVSNLSLAQNV
ncbi:phosphoglycolate phosphatase [Pseudoteredinibacter isoporae]|uniref:Phosphoglycolate phosphatase n=1 Tax=Pseudoteredinibacter isoporae TaxID=570281 RepID=A0A7X0MV40_9GAMM|nr:phosphoglycolate phosphatase [Pseudoteredinibacter isoporae]MBB6520968.1 phosphoglycolate phosphatase [Pseudoteredinibacter isoporae]NHO86533.1 phosphoglycolate phosphatase [Pseudoteredinibacter isoporae]NIB25015.1 phosphoglycolate phosphatase [Pseudoteredinibacter isoporae]